MMDPGIEIDDTEDNLEIVTWARGQYLHDADFRSLIDYEWTQANLDATPGKIGMRSTKIMMMTLMDDARKFCNLCEIYKNYDNIHEHRELRDWFLARFCIDEKLRNVTDNKWNKKYPMQTADQYGKRAKHVWIYIVCNNDESYFSKLATYRTLTANS